ncbi:MAG: EAL domain-containing protein [Nitrospirae bacterium]|nr:EAL domain-containing protein [Nitrospirota bacterium]
MERLEQFFKNHMDYVFLIYGFAFIFMGIAIALQPKGDSKFRLSTHIWLLSTFALLHGVNEWIDLMALLHPSQNILKVLSFIFCAASFCFLFEFGRKSLITCVNCPLHNYFQYLKSWLMLLGLFIISIFIYRSTEWITTGQILFRYFAALPGSLLTAAALLTYRREAGRIEHKQSDTYFIIAAVVFVAYGILGGLVVPKGSIFPSNAINMASFLSFTGIPIQVFRAMSALIIAFSTVGIIRLFNYEARKKNLQTTNSILSVSLQPISLEEQCREILKILMSIPWMHLQNKGSIFLADEENKTLRLAASHNFSDAQLAACSTLPYGKCLCGLSASTGEVVFSRNSREDGHSIRYENMPPHRHYCVPIISADRLLGVINFYLSEMYNRNDEDDAFLKSIAGTVAGVVLRKETEVKISQNYLIQSVVNQILLISLEPVSLKEQLRMVLDIISDVPWLLNKTTGCIFVIEDNPEVLVMMAHKGISLDLFKTCGHIPFGKCLCGQAAKTGKMIFKSSIDEHHVTRFENMQNHGHYCTPVISKEKVLGVINLYVPEGHKRNNLEDNFLASVSNVVAGMIERKIAYDRISHITSHDTLTGLPNRALFSDRLYYEMKSSKREGNQLAVFYIDIDKFKDINDAMGHVVGDTILKETAKRLTGCVREIDTVARMSSDEFSIIALNIATNADAEKMAAKILQISEQQIETSKGPIRITMSIGISVFPSNAMDAIELLKQSEIALYHSKKSGKNMFTFFNADMDAMIHERIQLENELRHAIDNNELIVHYQPQIDIKNGNLIGAEALVRWQHPQRGLIPPYKFIPIAEDTGLIIPLGEGVLRISCMQNSAWQKMGLPPITIAVNASVKQISRQYNFEDVVMQVIYETELKPHHLEVEITESLSMQNVDATIRLLRKLTSLGVQVSIDDFGTGYSSLSYLKNLPFKKLKIDRSFIIELSNNQNEV